MKTITFKSTYPLKETGDKIVEELTKLGVKATSVFNHMPPRCNTITLELEDDITDTTILELGIFIGVIDTSPY